MKSARELLHSQDIIEEDVKRESIATLTLYRQVFGGGLLRDS